MQDAINEISGIIECFHEVYKISIIHESNITIHYVRNGYYKKRFINSVELLEWCEENLTQTIC